MTALRKDLRTLDEKIAHLTAAVENGAALAPIVAKLQARQLEREALLSAIGVGGSRRVNSRSIDAIVEEKVLGRSKTGESC